MPDDSPPTIGSVFTLRPDAALEVLDRRATLRTSTYWSEVYADEHAGAFTAAKIAKLDIARTLFDGLRRALEEGRTPEMFIKDVRPSLERAGWWGVVEDASLTGTSDAVAITPSRLRRIYDTNMRGSRAAALWARFQDGKAERPYLRYSAVMDRRTRPEHRAWHGTILPVDHPWWESHFPPNGWNCRCTVISLSQRDLDRRGWKANEQPPPAGPGRAFRRRVRGGWGPVQEVPHGIDPGFEHNAGIASLRVAIQQKAAVSIEAAMAEGLPQAARATLDDLTAGPGYGRFLSRPAGSHPVMIMADEEAAAIGANARVVRLSDQTLQKQREFHPELTDEDYRRLPSLGDAPVVIVQPGGALVYVKPLGHVWDVAVVKPAAAGAEAYLVSFRVQSNPRSLRRLLKGGSFVRGGIEDLK